MPAPERARSPGVDLGLRASPVNGQILFEHLNADLGGRTPGRHRPTLLPLRAIPLQHNLALLLLFLLALAATLGDRLPIPTTGLAGSLQLCDRLLDTRRPRPLIDQLGGYLITTPTRPIQLVLGSIGGCMLSRRSRSQLPRPRRIDRGL